MTNGVDVDPATICMSMTEGNIMNLLTIWNGNIPYVVQNEMYASSGNVLLIFLARESIVSVISLLLQLLPQRKMAARFFRHGDHLAKVVLSGTPFLRPVQYDRMFLASVQYGNLLHVFTNANSRELFPGYIINIYLYHLVI